MQLNDPKHHAKELHQRESRAFKGIMDEFSTANEDLEGCTMLKIDQHVEFKDKPKTNFEAATESLLA